MLEGLKVVDFSTHVAGPAAGGILADWGASVVKIEGPSGDPTRTYFVGPEGSPTFSLDNRGKRSAQLDIARPEGREALIRILADADVLVTNVRPGGLRRARLDYDSISPALPRLVYCTVTGYGLTGPAADLPAFDMTAMWTRSGVAAATIPPDQEPYASRPAFGDHICAIAAVAGILAALHERQNTGRGRLVESSLLRTGTYALSFDLAVQLGLGEVATTLPRAERPNPLQSYFRTADGRRMLMTNHRDDQWPAIAGALGLEKWATDERFATLESRAANAPALLALLDEAFGSLTLDEASKRLTAAGVMWAPMQTPAEVAQDPYAEAAGCFVETPTGRGGIFRAPAGPVRFPGADDGPKGPAPELGQHTREVLTEAGYGQAEIDALFRSGAAA